MKTKLAVLAAALVLSSIASAAEGAPCPQLKCVIHEGYYRVVSSAVLNLDNRGNAKLDDASYEQSLRPYQMYATVENGVITWMALKQKEGNAAGSVPNSAASTLYLLRASDSNLRLECSVDSGY